MAAIQKGRGEEDERGSKFSNQADFGHEAAAPTAEAAQIAASAAAEDAAAQEEMMSKRSEEIEALRQEIATANAQLAEISKVRRDEEREGGREGDCVCVCV